MGPHVFLNLLNKLRKRDKMRALSSILPLFHEFNNIFTSLINYIIQEHTFDSTYQMTQKFLMHRVFPKKRQDFAIYRTLL